MRPLIGMLSGYPGYFGSFLLSLMQIGKQENMFPKEFSAINFELHLPFTEDQNPILKNVTI
jgi:hypothetical protein